MSKYYLLMVNEEVAARIGPAIQGLQFLEVQGMDVTGSEDKYKVLISPIVKPEEKITTLEQPVVEDVAPEVV